MMFSTVLMRRRLPVRISVQNRCTQPSSLVQQFLFGKGFPPRQIHHDTTRRFVSSSSSSPISRTFNNNHNHNQNPRIPPYIWLTAGGTLAALGYTYYSGLDQVPLTKRTRWIATSPQWEQQLGHQEYAQLKKQYAKDILPSSHRATQTVQRVGARIAQASHEFAQQQQQEQQQLTNTNTTTHSKDPAYTFTVVRSEMANAFVLPGNHVFVFTGLFQYMRNEDDLAAVLGHEAAHNLARHVGERISEQGLVQLLARLSLLIDPSGVVYSIFVPTVSLVRSLPHSRQHETEADEIGVYLAAKACYDPRAAPRVFAAMKADADGQKIPEFLSTHPSHDTRIAQFDQWLPQAMRLYQEEEEEITTIDDANANEHWNPEQQSPHTRHRCAAVRQAMQHARHTAAVEAQWREGQAQQERR